MKSIMQINKVVIIGSGAMGSGIAYVVAVAGQEVVLVDQEQQYLDAGMKRIREMIKDGITRGKMKPIEGEQLSKRFSSTLDLAEAAKGADLVIEAVYEDMALKKEIFTTLSNNSRQEAILASNTSTLSITEISSVVENPSRVIGLHFFNPPAAMKLVEVIVGEQTSDDTIEISTKYVEHIGKTPVQAKDSPGFIVNRVLAGMIGEAMKLYNDGVATAESIDKAMVLGANMPVGPLTLADFVGLDVVHASGKTLERELGETYKPSEILTKLVEEGKLGMKSGEGFYKYQD
ncbi:MAG: 3-hydroxyacyl-CoA dehydrogenase family protein [Candidatus Kariarchaeaceae archaeon]|jgi:3-hydroxybutyryl-CoA dehydrogenase